MLSLRYISTHNSLIRYYQIFFCTVSTFYLIYYSIDLSFQSAMESLGSLALQLISNSSIITWGDQGYSNQVNVLLVLMFREDWLLQDINSSSTNIFSLIKDFRRTDSSERECRKHVSFPVTLYKKLASLLEDRRASWAFSKLKLIWDLFCSTFFSYSQYYLISCYFLCQQTQVVSLESLYFLSSLLISISNLSFIIFIWSQIILMKG